MNNLREASDKVVEYILDFIPKKVLFRIFKFFLQRTRFNTTPDINILYISRGIFGVAVLIGIIFALINLEGYDNPITPTKEAMMNLNQYKKNKRNTKMKK